MSSAFKLHVIQLLFGYHSLYNAIWNPDGMYNNERDRFDQFYVN